MESGLFDINGNPICLGDKYINPGIKNSKIYTVFFKSGCFCGGIDESNCVPLAWEYDSYFEELAEVKLDFVEILKP